MTERILVVGAGAIGGVTAAHLTRAGHATVVLDADTDHVALLRSPGLRLEELDGSTSTVTIDAVSDPGAVSGRFDFAVVTVKSLHIEAALAPLVKRDLVDTYVSLGNGLVQQVVESVVGPDRLVVGLVEWGATNLGPGHLQQTTLAPMVLGETDGRQTERLTRLVDVLASVAETKTSTSITGQVWSKLLLNSTFSGLGAVGGCLYREIVTHPGGRELALRLWTEGYDVATALGMQLGEVFGVSPHELVVREGDDPASAHAALDRFMTRAGATKASMLQDLQRSRRTEVDVINGGVVSAAAGVGLEAPLNAELTRIVHECEEGAAEPGPHAFTRLLDLPRSGAGGHSG
jgi:2-dehydropantoate 2-reductase